MQLQKEPMYESTSAQDKEHGRAWEHYILGGLPHLRGWYDDDKAEDAYIEVTGVQLHDWHSLKDVHKVPKESKPYDDGVDAFLDDETLDKMFIAGQGQAGR